MSTMVYIKNQSPTSAVYKGTITPIQDFHCGKPPNVDHILIFGSEVYVFHESATWPGMTSKTWTGYLVGYSGRNQYQIYDPARHFVFLQRDVNFNEQVVGPPKPVITIDNSFEKETNQNSFVFLSLSYVIEEPTRFTNADTNPTLVPVSNIHETPSPLQPLDNPGSIMSQLPILLHNTETAQMREANGRSNNTAQNQPSNATSTPSNCIVAVDNSISGMAHSQFPNTALISNNATKIILSTFDDSDDSLSDAPPPLPLQEIWKQLFHEGLPATAQIKQITGSYFREEKGLRSRQTLLSYLTLRIPRPAVSYLTML